MTARPLARYVTLTFALSWMGALAVAAPSLLRHQPLSPLTRILMFPAMLLGPAIASVALTRLAHGRAGVRALAARLSIRRVPPRWLAFVLVPPALVLMALTLLTITVSRDFAPNHFWLGALFGVPAGLLEEIGWTGFALPAALRDRSPLAAGLTLGLIWSCWHVPVIDGLGAAAPHGAYWLAFFLAFAFAMTALRVVMTWAYTHVPSVLLAQLVHISSTGSLVVFGAAHVTPAQEAIWYAGYGALLWLVVALIVSRVAWGKDAGPGGPALRKT